MKRCAIFILLIFLANFNTLAQAIHCATMEQDSVNRIKFPEFGRAEDFEKVLQRKIQEIELRKLTGKTMDEVLTIPVVVHVIHKGEQVGVGSNISQAQVESQLEVLNEDFRRKVGTKGFNDDAVGADIEIEFCLAIVDPSGRTLSERGINRRNGNKDKWTRDEIEGSLKPSTIWDPDKYYNIWTVDLGGEDDRILGYAQFPSASKLPGMPENGGAASTDGVVVSYRHFGSSEKGNFPSLEAPYNKGRTLTHETGHFFGLRHIWGDGGCGADDFVSDTPPSDAPSRGCQVGRRSCGVVNMVENYMDYSEDGCMNIFTRGQKTRMRAVLELSPRRNSLFSANVCAPPVDAKPIANFRSDKTFVLRGSSVNFNDLSANFPTSWLWEFEGGEPSVSTLRNPVVRYDESDTFKVTLIATNAIGADTIVRESYIIVSPQGICADTTNFAGTPTLLPIPVEGAQGYLAGHNSLKHVAKAEYFDNKLGYNYINRASLRFGKAFSEREDATVKVTVWNARGPQGAPGAIVEQTEVLIKKIKEDIAEDRPTEVVFTRLAPLFSRGFFIGIQLDYQGDTVALITTKDGESVISTAWQQDESGRWTPYTIEYGVNVAHDITAILGIEPAVQVSASDQYVFPGERVVLNAKGASIFSWTSDDGAVVESLGAQLIVNPTQTTTYTVSGAGLSLCDSTASFTVFVNTPTSANPELTNAALKIIPNPTQSDISIELNNQLVGNMEIGIVNSLGQKVYLKNDLKTGYAFSRDINLRSLSKGVYILQIEINGRVFRKKLIKN